MVFCRIPGSGLDFLYRRRVSERQSSDSIKSESLKSRGDNKVVHNVTFFFLGLFCSFLHSSLKTLKLHNQFSALCQIKHNFSISNVEYMDENEIPKES